MKDFLIFRARLGAAIRRRRKEKGLTQAELAHRAQVEQSTIARIERGKQGWDSETIFSISLALECSLADLMVEAEQVYPERLPKEAASFAKVWMLLPPEFREDYRKRIEGLAAALRQPVPDENILPAKHTARIK